ncbi:MAG: tRNA (N(6)-L-threonylcarbamoyladenosine(37)-C(2))-methylthiotransferase MtaB [Lachnospiraceae bacterium]|nr:tRNA (N(6)-L-threonylcarbamoyladenosine(37)-C(2))-methylthiotransferase MtaB [Lachnospiraceae bacterium]MBR1472599.1 tRNA (N(6)-L-threonylcarbamoyladenosine(37)-C(2))-methylthiotransferase MtaB [Lachnospiraceae bacterium]
MNELKKEAKKEVKKEYRTASLHNLGCKVNAYEMDVMEELLREGGYKIVPFTEPADVVIINTCTVTNIADRKSRQMLHRAKKMNPDGVVVAVGCYVQTAAEEAMKDAGIDLCIGNNKKGELVQILAEYLGLAAEGQQKKIPGNSTVIDINAGCAYEDMQLKKISEHTRAYIKIQDGCNQFCTYCIIPFARGRVRSRRKEEILTEVRTLAQAGCREFVLTGIHISSYGYDLAFPEKRPMANQFHEASLLDLLKSMDEIAGVERIRLSSLEPRIITPEFVKGIAGIRSICPHFHLSLQSGSDSVLRRMNRQYDTADFAYRVQLLREAFDRPAITTDIIVGFPQETEEEFAQTLAFAERIGFYEMHIFKYSKRKGTPAAAMSGQLTEAQKAQRSDRLEAVEKGLSAAFRKDREGSVAEVLAEEFREVEGKRYLVGHTREYLYAAMETDADLSGQILQVRIGSAFADGMVHAVILQP